MHKPPRCRKTNANLQTISAFACPEVRLIVAKAKATPQENMLRLPQAKMKIGRARSTIWKDVKSRTLPPPIPLGARAVAWRESELQAWIEVRILESRIGKSIDMGEFVTLLTSPEGLSEEVLRLGGKNG